MPFTVTHVAAVVPAAWLCRWRVPLSALAIGAMIPDISGFYPGLFDHTVTHSFLGVFTHSVPLGITAFYLFHLLLKQPLVDLLPSPLSRRLDGWSRGEIDVQPMRLLMVAISVAFGALTHVIWDAFTHGDTWGVALVPSLQRVVTYHNGHPIRAYAIVQHGSSLLFLPPLLLGFIWWVMNQTPSQTPCRARMPHTVALTVGAMILVGAWLYFQSLHSNLTGITWVGALRITVKHMGALSMAVLLLYCVGMQLVWWYQSGQRANEADGAFAGARELGLEYATVRSEIEVPVPSREPGNLHAAQTVHDVLRPRFAPKPPANARAADPSP